MVLIVFSVCLYLDLVFGLFLVYIDELVMDVFVNGVGGLFFDWGVGVELVFGWCVFECEVCDFVVFFVGFGGWYFDD